MPSLTGLDTGPSFTVDNQFDPTHLADHVEAYDRFELNYLGAVMLTMGFSSRWVLKTIQCVSTVSFTVLLNGGKMDEFKPSRGI